MLKQIMSRFSVAIVAVLLANLTGVSASENVAVKYSGHDLEYLRALEVSVVLDRNGNEAFRQICREKGIAYWRIYNVFTHSNPSIPESNMTLIGEDGSQPQGRMARRRFFSPAWDELREAKIKAIIDDVASSRPDGISLDMVRWYLESDAEDRPRGEAWEWESIGPEGARSRIISFSFDPVTLSRFEADTGIDLPEGADASAAARKLLTQHKAEWAQWKADQVTQTVAAIRDAVHRIDPDIRIMVQLVPWAESEYSGALKEVVGQDLGGLAQATDVFSPMAYHALLGRSAGWISTYAETLQDRTGVAVWPCIQAMGHQQTDREPFTPTAVISAWKAAVSGDFDYIALYGPREGDAEIRQTLQEIMHEVRED